MDLENDYNIVMNHKKIKRIMKKFALVTKVRKAKPYSKILRAAKEHRTVKNLLNRNFDEKTPRKVLLTDITYLYYSNGQRAYLSAVRDLASSEILVYYLSTSIDMEIAYKTLDRLEVVLGETLQPDVMLHSDQGVHYTNPSFQNKLKSMGITQSMSRKGNCLDNAPMESFFGHMKDEVDYKQATSFAELKSIIRDYIHYYNYNRYQWTRKKMTPVQYRNHLLAA